jgi:hypothetical protein
MSALFTLDCTGLDSSVLVNFNIQNVDPSAIRNITIYSNDSNANQSDGSYSYTNNNAFWKSYYLSPAEIKSGSALFEGLTNGKSYIFKAMLLYKTETGVAQVWSDQSKDIALIKKPLALTLTGQDGKSASSTSIYDIYVAYPTDFFNEDLIPDKIVFLLYINVIDNDNIEKVTQKEFFKNIDFSSSNRPAKFRLPNLHPDNTYEVTCVSVKGYQTVMSAETVQASPSSKPTPPVRPTAEFNYATGAVDLTTKISSPGAGTNSTNNTSQFHYVLQTMNYNQQTNTYSVNKTTASISINYNIFTETPLSFTLSTTDCPSDFFTLGETSYVRFLAYNSDGAIDAIDPNNILTFVPMKYAERITDLNVDSIMVGEGQIKYTWTRPGLNGPSSLFSKYVLTLTDRDTVTNADAIRTYDIVTNVDNFTTNQAPLRYGTRYYASIKAVTNNSVNRYNSSTAPTGIRASTETAITIPETIDGILSSTTGVWATPYRLPSAPTLHILYTENDVNSKATFTIDPISNSDLPLEKYQIVHVDNNGNEINDTLKVNVLDGASLTNIPPLSLVNGTSYKFKVRSIINTQLTVSQPPAGSSFATLQNISINGLLSTDAQNITPWSKPGAPTISRNTRGNHYIKVTRLEGSNIDTGLTLQKFRYAEFPEVNDTALDDNTDHIFFNLVNDFERTITVKAVYTNPNTGADIEVQGNNIKDTPFYTNNDYRPTGISASAIEGGSVNVSWIAPATQVNDDQMGSVLSYNIYSVIDPDPAPAFIANVSSAYSSLSPYTIAAGTLVIGTTYKIRIEAVYNDASTVLDGDEVAGANSTDVVIPYKIATAPRDVSVSTVGDTTLRVTYTEPLDIGGSPSIIGYVIYYKQYHYDKVTSMYNLVNEFGSQPFSNSDLFNDLIGLTNGNFYEVAVAAVGSNPNNNASLEGAKSSYTTLKYMPRPPQSELPQVVGFAVTDNGYDAVEGATTGQIRLAWSAITDPDVINIGFQYIIQQVQQDYSTTVGQRILVASGTTSQVINNLNLGERVYYVIHIETKNDAISPPVLGPVNDNNVNTIPYDSTPTSVQGVSAFGSNENVRVSWTIPAGSTVGGAPIAGYKVYKRNYGVGSYTAISPNVDSTLSYLDIPGTNGDKLQFYVAYVLTTGQEGAFVEGTTREVAATPFRAPDAATLSIDQNTATENGEIVIVMDSVSEAHGSGVTSYELFEKIGNGSPNKVIGSISFPLSLSGRAYGTLHTYYAVPIYVDKNTDAEVSGPLSNEVTKIPFKADAAPTINSIFNASETSVRIYYTFSAAANDVTGLTASSQKLLLNTGISGRNDIEVSGSDYLLEDIFPGTILNLRMRSQFQNPNLLNISTAKVESALSANRYFTAYGTPEIGYFATGETASFQKGTVGDRAVQVKFLNSSLILKSGVFQRYQVTVYEADSEGNRKSNTAAIASYPVNSQTAIYKIDNLINNFHYRIEAVAVTLGAYHSTEPNAERESNTLYVLATPSDTAVPQILSFVNKNSPNDTSVQLKIQTYYQDITKVILFLSPTAPRYYYNGTHPAQLYYEHGSVNHATANASGEIIVTIPLQSLVSEPFVVGSIEDLAAIAVNSDGVSETFFDDLAPNNYLYR